MMKAIIFDFDGVIFDSEPLHFEACNHVFNELGFTISYEDYLVKYVGLSDSEIFPKILTINSIQLNASEINQLINKKIASYAEIVTTKKILQATHGIHAFLEAISKKSSRIAICSGSKREEIDAALSRLENGMLREYFNVIVTADDVSEGKPSPEGYLLTAKKLGVQPEECLVIEDTTIGIKAAKRANMYVIALSTTNPKNKLTEADRIVKDFSQLPVESLSV